MKRYIILCIILICTTAEIHSAQPVSVYLNVNFEARASFVIQKFKEILPEMDKTIAYTKVPRGLVVSIAEDEIFHKDSAKLTEQGKELLTLISTVLKNFNNACAIETHTDESLTNASGYKQDWEISIHRANVIAQYLTTTCKVDSNRLYPIGYGKIMPFNGNVSRQNFPDNRIDFVIFDYTAQR